MTRVVRLLALAAATVLALAACASTGDPPAADPQHLRGTVTVLAAASLTESLDALAAEFEADNPEVDVVLSYGGSSALAEQIVQGAPADLFAAANVSTMQTVDAAGLAVAPTVFASNTLVLVVPNGNPAGVTGLGDLARDELAIALCDAEVPCGAATAQLLELAGVEASPDTLEADVKAVLTRVELGEADAGLVYRTDLMAAGDAVDGVEVPEAGEAVNRYLVALLADAPNPAAAAAFLDLILGAAGQAVFAEAGFGAP